MPLPTESEEAANPLSYRPSQSQVGMGPFPVPLRDSPSATFLTRFLLLSGGGGASLSLITRGGGRGGEVRVEEESSSAPRI